MTDFVVRFGQWGLVAGAAEGIGAAYCEELARKGLNVILIDINSQGMNLLAENLESKYQVQTHSLVLDLAEPEAPGKCMEVIREYGCRLLIYNAAYSRVEPFLAAGPEELDLYLNINARTPLHLVHLFTRELKENKAGGGVLLMSSLAGLWGTRLVAAYSGTKGFNLALAEALSHELRDYGIAVSACCAGAIATPGYLGTNPKYGMIRPNVMDPGRVASIALRNLGKKAIIIPGFSNKVTYFILTRILPRSISAALVNHTMANTYQDKL
jgi:short-subunit dehydrogenase